MEQVAQVIVANKEYKPQANVQSITIGKTPMEIYAFLNRMANFALFMAEVKGSDDASGKIANWIMKGSDKSIEWKTTITENKENESIKWQSLENSEVVQSAQFWLEEAPKGLGTVVTLAMDYQVRGGKASELFLKLLGEDPVARIKINLRRLKAYLETGEIPTIEGQPNGKDEKSGQFKH